MGTDRHARDDVLLRINGVRAPPGDPAYRAALHRLEHADAVEFLFVEPADVHRKRFRLRTDRGTDCAVTLARDETLSDGALLHLDDRRAVIARFGAERLWRLRPADADAALALGWNAGNLHWRVRFEDGALTVLLDGPLAEYRARIAELLRGGRVREAGVPDGTDV